MRVKWQHGSNSMVFRTTQLGVFCLFSTTITTMEENTSLELCVGFTSCKRVFEQPGTYLLGGLPRFVNTNSDLPSVCAITDKACTIVSHVKLAQDQDNHQEDQEKSNQANNQDDKQGDLQGVQHENFASILERSKPFFSRSVQTCKVGHASTIQIKSCTFVVSINVGCAGMSACKLFADSVLVGHLGATCHKVRFDVELNSAKQFSVCPSFEESMHEDREHTPLIKNQEHQVDIQVTRLNFLTSSGDHTMFFQKF